MTAPDMPAPRIGGIRGVPASSNPPTSPRAPAGVSSGLNHAGGNTDSARGDGAGGNTVLASADTTEPARLTPVLTRLAFYAAAKPVWRVYLPEVPPA